MPTRKKGNELDAMERATVLAGFPWRWTTENKEQAERLFAPHGGPPTMEPDTDDQWLANHAFWFNKDGRLTAGKVAEWIGDSWIGGSKKRAGDVNS